MNTELAIVGVLSVILNSLFFCVCVKKKPQRKSPKYFLLSLVIIDVMAVAGWLSLTVVSLFKGTYVIPANLCKVQQYTLSMCLYMNSHSFVLLAFERFFLSMGLSKHAGIFINSIILIMLQTLWLFDGALAAFPYFGWGTVGYFSNQFQCAMDHEKNIRETHFIRVMCFGLPISLCLGIYMFISFMIGKIRIYKDGDGTLIGDVNMKVIGNFYSQRLKNQQLKGTGVTVPNSDQIFTYKEDGNLSNESTDNESTSGKTVQKDSQNQTMQQKKVYHKAKNDSLLTKTYIILTYVVFLLWLPYVIDTYVFMRNGSIDSSDEIVFVVVFLCQCTTFIKPVVYVIYNTHFRKHLMKCFQRKPNTQKKYEVAVDEHSYNYNTCSYLWL